MKFYKNPSLGYYAVPCEEMDIRTDNTRLVVAVRFASACKWILKICGRNWDRIQYGGLRYWQIPLPVV